MLYGSYTLLFHAAEVNGRLPFSTTSMNICIEILKVYFLLFFYFVIVKYLKILSRYRPVLCSSAVSIFSYFVRLWELNLRLASLSLTQNHSSHRIQLMALMPAHYTANAARLSHPMPPRLQSTSRTH